jgi:hypothetical protein
VEVATGAEGHYQAEFAAFVVEEVRYGEDVWVMRVEIDNGGYWAGRCACEGIGRVDDVIVVAVDFDGVKLF